MYDLKGAVFNRSKMLQGMAAAAVAVALLLAASYSAAAEHGLDEKALSQVPENLHAQASTSIEKKSLKILG
ncbi:uncharacterized protein METZ01_LOCUS234328, partial [marine metagenome]